MRPLSRSGVSAAMADVSSRELRDNTIDVLRRVEAGERLRITVNRRAVAELVPLDRSRWTDGAAMEEAPGGGRGPRAPR